MNAYNEMYLYDAMKNLGEAFDYAVNCCESTVDEFDKLFIASRVAEGFAKGNPMYVSGKSGTEMAADVYAKCGRAPDAPKVHIEYECSPEYWTGWVLAYYQWKTGRSFAEIYRDITPQNILSLYPTLHETSEDYCADCFDDIIGKQEKATALQRQRKLYGYSQRELSEKSGVNLRTLQQYELGTKALEKASVQTVKALALTLGCRMEDIID